MIRKLLAPVVSNVRLPAPGHYVLTFEAGEMARDAIPGQFVTVAAETGAQVLRRPFSFFAADPNTGLASILYSLHGATTHAIAKYGPGDKIDIIGPLGGRVFAPDTRPGTLHIMVGGGYGVPPLVFLAHRILEAQPDAKVVFINGARTREFLVGTDGLEEIGVDLILTTDDGSHGRRGVVTVALSAILSEAREIPTQIYTCGPVPMMRAVAAMAHEFDVPCQVSMEVFMPCGIGICMGCAVQKQDGTYARGCLDGPVFDSREIVWI